MSVWRKIVFVLMLSTKFTECNQFIKVIRYCLFVYTLVGVRSEDPEEPGRIGHLVPLERATNSRSLIRYCDMNKPVHEMDPFMNRIVAIIAYDDLPRITTHNTTHTETQLFGSGEVITTGVLINTNHVLSSYNPFRNLREGYNLSLMRVYYYRARWDFKKKFHGYLIEDEDFSCARQVVPLLNITDELWHGTDRLHSPVHDLIVFKTKLNISLTDTDHWNTTKNDRITNLSPLVTKLADRDDTFGDNLKLVSLGFVDDDHITNKNHLRTVQLNREDRVLVNCDEWFIRNWGYFFCVRNVNGYIGIGSGAFLFSQEKVFGVGSFTLQKGNDSILVFTDVRPYNKVIFQTCTEKDGHADGNTTKVEDETSSN